MPLTPEQEQELVKAAQEFVDRIERGECGQCGAKITDTNKVGRCVYAIPCGHRLGQGR